MNEKFKISYKDNSILYKDTMCERTLNYTDLPEIRNLKHELDQNQEKILNKITNKKLSELPTRKRMEIIKSYLYTRGIQEIINNVLFKKFRNKKIILTVKENGKNRIKKIKFEDFIKKK